MNTRKQFRRGKLFFSSVLSDLLSNLQSSRFRSSFVCFSSLLQEANKYTATELKNRLDSATFKANQTESRFKSAFKRCHEAHADLAAAIIVHRQKVLVYIYICLLDIHSLFLSDRSKTTKTPKI